MAQLWGGRFTKQQDDLVKKFNDSLPYDRRLYRQDIRGSIVHATMLGKQGILTDDEMRQIVDGLSGILDDIENGRLAFSDAYEDIHSFVEANLIDRIGDAGKKLHTGRSRNDQVALDMKMYIRPGYEDVHPGRNRGNQRTAQTFSADAALRDGGKQGDLHAGIHAPPEGAAGHACPSHGSLLRDVPP